MGNFYVVVFVDDFVSIFFDIWGVVLEVYLVFFVKINVYFFQVYSCECLEIWVWEWGVGLILVCGIGVCVILVVVVLLGFVDDCVEVVLFGGLLMIEWCDCLGFVLMIGLVEVVFDGVMMLELMFGLFVVEFQDSFIN